MPHRARMVALGLWPGLALIWSGREVFGLALGVVFAASLNVTLAAGFLWTEALPPAWVLGSGTLAAGVWSVGFGSAVWRLGVRDPEGRRREVERLYREATESYLRGRLAEARDRLEAVLALDGDDAEALLRLGTVFARAGQPGPARRAFRRCLETGGGARWRWEIGQALAFLEGAEPGAHPGPGAPP